MKDRYDVVVIGSGYGGGIAASRLARAGKSVAVLERGREIHPGEYPDTTSETIGQIQIDLPFRDFGSTDLYDLRNNEEVNILVGCGLGGTSLINAGVALRASDWVFEEEAWPEELRGDGLEDRWYEHAEEMLRPTTWPEDRPLPKLAALHKAAGGIGLPGERAPINVNLEDRVNHVGVEQRGCVGCGDCMTGCNYGAKNTVLETYLPDAVCHGAQLFCETSVRFLEREEGHDHWVVNYEMLDARRRGGASHRFVIGDVVVLAAGVLGSTEILLRSRRDANGLSFSETLGTRFSANGDSICFAYDCADEVNAVGTAEPGDVGPTITGMIDDRDRENPREGLMIQEGSFARGIAKPAAGLLWLANKKLSLGDHPEDDPSDAATVPDEAAELPKMERTLPFLIFGHDESGGSLKLEHDRLRIDWDGVGKLPVYKETDRRGKQLASALDDRYIPNPVWSKFLGYDSITVHPLGGCPLGDNASKGVVNHKGQVFVGKSGDGVYENLYVADGSIVPTCLGVNPHLTICALAERSVFQLAEDRGWSFDYDLDGPGTAKESTPVSLTFTETMHGFWSPAEGDGGPGEGSFENAAEEGRKAGRQFAFFLDVTADDVDKTIEDPEHAARLDGMFEMRPLEPEPMRASNGEWHCFRKREDPDTYELIYRFHATSEQGKRYYFDGYKVVRDDFGPDMWPDTTTLYVTVRAGEQDGEVIARGVMRLNMIDFLQILPTMRVIRAPSPVAGRDAKLRFSAWFVGSIREIYGINMT